MNNPVRLHYETLAEGEEVSWKTVGYWSEGSWRGIHQALGQLLPESLSGRKILDVGCGHGRMSMAWSATNQLYGVDLAINMLRLSRAGGLRCVQADGRHLPFPDATFDLTLAIEMAQHVYDLDALLSALARVTRVGGIVVVGTANRTSLLRRVYSTLSAVLPGKLRSPVPLHPRSLDELLGAAAHQPMVPEQVALSLFPFPFTTIRNAAHWRWEGLAANYLLRLRRVDGGLKS